MTGRTDRRPDAAEAIVPGAATPPRRPAAKILVPIWAALLGAAACSSPPSTRSAADVVIRGGQIFDGSASRAFVGDVAVRGDRIVFVGRTNKNPYVAGRIIDATGLIVAPGFIDPHTHADAFLESQDAQQRLILPWMMQGVTTIVAGVDGVGLPGTGADVGGFLRDFDRRRAGLNIAAYVGFDAVRSSVLAQEARAPTAPELADMKSLVAKGMCDGALGLSTGLFYAPQSFATTSEVIEVAREAAKRGGIYDTHQRDESSYSVGLIASTKEAIEIGRAAGLPVHLAHLKALGVDVHGKAPELIALIEAARASGLDVTADQYPWQASGSRLEDSLLPRWAVEGGRSALLRRLDTLADLSRIRAEMAANLRRRGGPQSLLLTAPGLPWTGKRLGEVAQQWNVPPVEAALRMIRQQEGGTSLVSFNMIESDIKAIMRQKWVMTSSDGSTGHPHPRMYATFPQKYAKYVLKERTISLAEFINSSTGRTADKLRLAGRGHLRQGHFADIVVFDPRRYRPAATYLQPAVLTPGVQALLVNGALAIDEGVPTGASAGRAIRRTVSAGDCA